MKLLRAVDKVTGLKYWVSTRLCFGVRYFTVDGGKTWAKHLREAKALAGANIYVRS